jgi:hypothetical protein
VIEAMQERLDRKPDAMRIRRATAEHPLRAIGSAMFKLGVWIAFAVLPLAAPGLAAARNIIWARAATSGIAMQGDLTSCVAKARNAPVQGFSLQPEQPVFAIQTMLTDAIQGTKSRAISVRACMFVQGYHAVALSADEVADLRSLNTPDATAAWADRFYHRADFDQRLAAAVSPPLPEATNEPLAYGAVRFHLAELTPATGVVKVGGVALTGEVSHRRTARLAQDADIRPNGFDDIIMPAGTLLQQAVLPDVDGSKKTFWCGPYKVIGLGDGICMRNDPSGYVLIHPDGARWITTSLNRYAGVGSADRDTVKIEVSATDLAGPMNFGLAVRKLRADSVSLEAVVSQGHDYETLWQATLPFDANGAAVLPFWTHRLVLTRSNDGVTVALTADGDGAGWP